MVRQRLAQIERNHSQISAQSGYSDAAAGLSTPVTPITKKTRSPGTSHPGSLKSGSSETSEESSKSQDTETPKVMSRARSMDTGRNTPSSSRYQEESSKPPYPSNNDSKQPPVKWDEKESAPKLHLTKEDIEDLSKRIAEVKGALGGESGCPTIHQVVLGLEDRAQDNKRMLKTMQERIEELGGCLKDVQSSTGAASTGNDISLKKGTKNDDTQESILRAIENVKEKLLVEFPSLHDKVQGLQSAQAGLLEKIQDKEQSNVSPTTAQDLLDLKSVLNKLDELLLLQLEASQKTAKELEAPEGGSQILDVSAKLTP